MPDENELYQEWFRTPAAERAELENQLAGLVRTHIRAIVWEKMKENNPDLVQDIAMAVMSQIGDFRQQSKFSYWVSRIAANKINYELRRRYRERGIFNDSVIVAADAGNELESESDRRPTEMFTAIVPNIEGLIAFEELADMQSNEDATLIRYKKEGLSSGEIADRMGTTVEAIDSRWARLKRKFKKYFSPSRRK